MSDDMDRIKKKVTSKENVDEFERRMSELPNEMFCPVYNKLLIVSLRNMDGKNRRALLLHVPNCEHRFCKIVGNFFEGVIDNDIFMNMVRTNIKNDEERSTKEWK